MMYFHGSLRKIFTEGLMYGTILGPFDRKGVVFVMLYHFHIMQHAFLLYK